MEDAPAAMTARPGRPSVLAAIAAAGLVACLVHARPAEAAPTGASALNPFGHGPAAPSLNPLRRLTQAEPPPAAPAVAPAAAPAVAKQEGEFCRADSECPGGTICENSRCVAFERPIHALLFRKEGGSTAFIPFYWGHRGNPGYRIVAPFYWHFWSPQDRTQIVAPFYWRFEDYLKQRVLTVVLLYSHSEEPGAQSWGLWPLFYRSTKFGWAIPFLFAFDIEDPDTGKNWGLWGPLYFWKRDHRAQTAFDLFVPFFVSSRSPESTTTFALPLNLYWRRGDNSHLLAFPLFYRQADNSGSLLVSPIGYMSRDGDSRHGAMPWLYWYGRDKDGAYDLAIPFFYWSRHAKGGAFATLLGYYSRDGETKRGSVAWLYWWKREPSSSYDVLFPLVWSFRSPSSSTTVVANLIHVRRPDYHFTTFLPLYWAGGDHEKGSAWRLLFPLYFSRTGEGDRTFTWITPAGGYRRDDDAGTRTLFFWPVPFAYRRDPLRELDMALLLYWRHKDLKTGAATWLVGPYYRNSDPTGSSTALFPLFWHFHDAATGATAHALLPFYFFRGSPDETTVATPVGYYRSFKAGGWSAGLFPLAFFGQKPDRGHGVIFPLFWHFRDRQGSSTVAFPVYYDFADRRGETGAVPPLLWFWGSDVKGDRYHVQFPFFWRFSNDKTGDATTVVGPFFKHSSGDERNGWYAGLFPLVFAGSSAKGSHFALAPLFWRFRDEEADRTTTVVLNYLHRRHGGETTDALFPLLHYRRGARPGGSDETSFTLFPLLHYRRDARSTVFASPLAMWTRSTERKAGFVLPYFWYESKAVAAQGVPPLWFDFTRKEDSTRTRIFGPWVSVDAPDSRARVLFPLFGRYEDAQDSGTWIFPTFFHRRSNDGYALDTLFPVFWRSTAPGRSTTVVGPYFQHSAPDRAALGFVPLFVYHRNPERSLLVAPLFFRHANFRDETSHMFVLPSFYRSTRREGHTTVLFPLFFSARTGPRRHMVFFPLLWHFANDEEDSATTLAGPFYWSHTGSTQRTRGILPLAWYSRDDETESASHAVLPVFYEKHGRTERTVLTALFGFRSQIDRGWWYALPILTFRRDTPESTFTTVFPLYFGHYDKATETSTRIIPVAYFSRSRPDRALTNVLLLFWHQRDISSSTTLGLPLFYDVHNYHQSRVTLLIPLFLRYWRAEDDTAYNFAPFFYRRSSPNDSTTVAFPLFWDFKHPDSRTTVFFPVYWHFRRPTYTARFIFPNIYYREGTGTDAGTSRLFIPPLWESAVKRPGDYMWEAVLGLVGYERIGRNRYFKLFFYPFELEPAPAAQTSWYGRPPPTHARPQRRYGLDTRAW